MTTKKIIILAILAVSTIILVVYYKDFHIDEANKDSTVTPHKAEPTLEPIPEKVYTHVDFTHSNEAFTNPYMGYMPFASILNKEEYPRPDFTLAFALMYWKDVEKEKGVYDFTYFEEVNNFDHLHNNNIKIIIRLVVDYPGLAGHIDIPKWLYEEMNGAGTYYDDSRYHGAAGFAPDYENPYFMERHELLIQEIAKKYDGAYDIAFIQLGSLGHWGEWHNYHVEGGYFPDGDIEEIYIKQYTNAFKETLLQIRRPTALVKSEGIGLYNDMIGHSGQTDWLIEQIKLHGMTDFYLNTPLGGEFASSYTMAEYFGSMYNDVKKMIIDTNTTYTGCMPPTDSIYLANRLDLLKTMGYRMYVSSASYTPVINPWEQAEVHMTIQNKGVAPFYYDWPLYLLLYQEDGSRILEYKIEYDIRNIIPGEEYVLSAVLPALRELGEYTIKFGFFDPFNQEKNSADIRLANNEAGTDNMLFIGKFSVAVPMEEEKNDNNDSKDFEDEIILDVDVDIEAESKSESKSESKELFNYEYDNKYGGIRLTQYLGTNTIVKVPETVDGFTVVSIAWQCFANGIVTEVYYPETIEYFAYGKSTDAKMKDSKTIVIPYGVLNIPSLAFEEYDKLEEIRIPETVTKIENWAFIRCYSLIDIEIPFRITEIGNGMFDSCYALTKVTLPEGITKINDGAFFYCLSLIDINIPDSVTFISDTAFKGCVALPDEIKQMILLINPNAQF